ncbi:TetR/AcrR family transcriptional regulator [Chitinophagaceae bacterium MMS25-I14]
MGITERKEREKQEMRDNIIAAAVTMFTEDGYEKTSIRRIADKIEYSPGTIYLYYKDKDELLYDVQRLAFDKLFAEFEQKVKAENPLDRLKEICDTYVGFGISQPDLYDLMFIIRAPMNVLEEKHKWTNSNDCFEFLVKCVQDCIDQKLVRFQDPLSGAIAIWAMGHGLISLDIRCRFKFMDITDSAKTALIYNSMKAYLDLIKA